jgi:nucleoside-diphosphate-sugar epimerase
MILVTGVSGFVGRAVVKRLVADGIATNVVAAMRRSDGVYEGVRSVQVGDMHATTDWSQALKGVKAIVHCAARVHVMQEASTDPLEEYRQVNVKGTLSLALQASRLGVRRFVFVSSIKVNGEATLLNHPFTADDMPAPLDPYGISKLEAEKGLREIEFCTGMEVVIIRSPIVYGYGVKANFASLLIWVARGIPLPLGSIQNLRSMVALDNLVDLLVTCLTHPAASGQTLLVSDGEDVSTSELLRLTGQAMGKTVLLIPIPTSLLKLGATFLGKEAIVKRLCDSLQVDIEKTRRLIGWNPPLTLKQGLVKVIEGLKP